MYWDEIEAKWAAMARRVRSDLPATSGKPGREEDPPRTPPGDLPNPAPDPRPTDVSVISQR